MTAGNVRWGGAGGAFRQHVHQVMSLDPGAPAVEFDARWSTWGDLAETVRQVVGVVDSLSLRAGEQIGVLLPNRPTSIGALLGVLGAGGCVVVLNPHLGPQRVSEDVAGLGLRFVVGEPTDLERLFGEGPPGLATLAISGLGREGDLHVGGEPRGDGPDPRPEAAIRLLTSGTTGPPKRVDLTFATLDRVLQGAKHYEARRDAEVRLREGVVIVNAPLVHLGGIFRVLQAAVDGRRMALLERFTVEEWVDRVRRHRPKTASLVPAALRMVLEADVEPGDLSSLRSVISGTAPLEPEVADAFTAKYGVPVLTNYAATEFGGGVAGWNLADHRRFWSEKRGSVGRAHAGCALRVVDEATGLELAAGEVGLLEVRADQLADAGWVRTTDLAWLDGDGFLWIVGRADQTIIRGGLKVQPDTVRGALERHPAVRAASVVGVDDARLGQVPVAVVELAEDGATGEAELLGHLSQSLARYEIPVKVVVVERIPRTESAKVDLAAVRAIASGATDRSKG